ncbi:MAG: RNA polymerase sigma factor [bacterium]|nr:RNA polymerase sigma factor [bacterium]
MRTPEELTNEDNRNQNELIRQVRQGDQQAFTQLVGIYQEQVFKLAFGFFRDRDDAMEIVQETFLRIYEKIHGFDHAQTQTAFKNWVYRIAYNLCIDFYRKFKKVKADNKELYDFFDGRERETTNPEDLVDRQHFQNTIKKGVMKLSKRQQMVFTLKQYSNLKHHEIADILKVSVGTTKSLYHRAVKNLEKQLIRLEVAK